MFVVEDSGSDQAQLGMQLNQVSDCGDSVTITLTVSTKTHRDSTSAKFGETTSHYERRITKRRKTGSESEWDCKTIGKANNTVFSARLGGAKIKERKALSAPTTSNIM